MNRVHGDPIDAWTGADGHPARFVWRGRLFIVRRLLDHWVATPDCVRPVPHEFWRVEADHDRDLAVYELRRAPGTDAWILSRPWD